MSDGLITFIIACLPLVLLGIAGAFWRNGIVAFLEERVRQGVKHEYDKKLEDIRAELRERGKEMEFLRSGALTAMSSRQAALAERQMKAVDQIWYAITARRGAMTTLIFLTKMEPEDIADVAKDTNASKLLLSPVLEIINDDRRNDWAEAKPFVSDMTWALVYAYCNIVSVFAVAVGMLKLKGDGSSIEQFLTMKPLTELVKAALPEYEQMIEKKGFRCYDKCLEALERNILSNLKDMIDGKSMDKENVERAESIIKYADAIKMKSDHDTMAAG